MSVIGRRYLLFCFSAPRLYGDRVPVKLIRTTSSKVRQKIVDTHNYFRTQVKPPAANMLVMVRTSFVFLSNKEKIFQMGQSERTLRSQAPFQGASNRNSLCSIFFSFFFLLSLRQVSWTLRAQSMIMKKKNQRLYRQNLLFWSIPHVLYPRSSKFASGNLHLITRNTHVQQVSHKLALTHCKIERNCCKKKK